MSGEKMNKTTIETIMDIISTIGYEDVNFAHSEFTEVEDIADFTDKHYTGPGSLISFWIEAGIYGRKWEDSYIVFDDNDNFVGIKREDFFEDIDPNWWKK